MDNKYIEVKFSCGSDIKNAVNQLLKLKQNGILACGEFNGTKLYSDTVIIDSAYQQITGKTYKEFQDGQQKWKENINKREDEFQKDLPKLIENWKIKARNILFEDKWESWDKIVPIRAADLYHGMELDNCLDIIKIINMSGDMERAKEMIESQDHSGMSYSLVCSMVKAFCDRGEEFCKYVR